jgi:hypothetical protein
MALNGSPAHRREGPRAERYPVPRRQDAATTAADPHVRFRAVELLASWLPRHPAVRSVLEQIARDESEPRIREAAQTAL